MTHDYDMSDYKMFDEKEPKQIGTGNWNFTGNQNQNSTNKVHLPQNSTIVDDIGNNSRKKLSGWGFFENIV